MRVHLKQIPHGETLRVEGEEGAEELGLEEAGVTPVGPLRYCLDLGVSEDGLFATGTLQLRVRMQCVVTLEDFEEELVIDPFVIQKELHGRELVDLTPEIREDIHLALPAHPRSKAASEKSPFARSATHVESAPTAEGGSPWGVLDQLKNN
ncbi:MAG: hypothetical protein WEB60_10065 [Terrimicrobiaceae bacterium]